MCHPLGVVYTKEKPIASVCVKDDILCVDLISHLAHIRRGSGVPRVSSAIISLCREGGRRVIWSNIMLRSKWGWDSTDYQRVNLVPLTGRAALDLITEITIGLSTARNPTAPTGSQIALQFNTYASGTRLLVYLSADLRTLR